MIAWIWTAGLLAQAAQDIKLESQDPAYVVTLPKGYEQVPGESRYFRPFGRELWYRINLSFAAAPGPLVQNPSGITSPEVLPFVALPPDAVSTFSTMKWKDFDIGVVEYSAVVKDIPVIGLAVVLPLKGKALTISVSGPTTLEKETREDFKEIFSRIGGTATNWFTEEEIQNMLLLDLAGKAGAGLFALYPVVWALFFRGHPMRAHGLRIVWLFATALLLFVPVTSSGPTTVLNNLITNAVLPCAMILFAVRRIKLGIEAL